MAKAALEQSPAVSERVSGATCVILIAGLSGSTGSAAAPVIAKAVKTSGVLTIGLPIIPLEYEPIGTHLAAADSLDLLRRSCDAVLEIPRSAGSGENSVKTGLREAFEADRRFAATFVATVSTAVNAGPGRCDANPGDLKSVLRNGASAVFGSGSGIGHTGAAEAAISCLDAAFTASDLMPDISRALVLIESGPEISVSHIATVTSIIETLPSRTARASGRRRAPLQAWQGWVAMNCPISSRCRFEVVSRKRRWMLGITPSKGRETS